MTTDKAETEQDKAERRYHSYIRQVAGDEVKIEFNKIE